MFYNKPIISYAIKTLKESKLFNEIHVSTNSFNIKDIVEKFSLKIPFIRPNYLSKDSTPLIKVINYVLDKYAKKKIYFDEVWFVITPLNPDKVNENLTDQSIRLEMTQKYCDNEVDFKYSDIEFSLPKPNYTADTLTALSPLSSDSTSNSTA